MTAFIRTWFRNLRYNLRHKLGRNLRHKLGLVGVIRAQDDGAWYFGDLLVEGVQMQAQPNGDILLIHRKNRVTADTAANAFPVGSELVDCTFYGYKMPRLLDTTA